MFVAASIGENSSPLPSSASATEVKRYRVFLSYSHADTKWARWLMRQLEGYTVPSRFHGRLAPIGEVGRRIAPVFRDRDELPTTSDLGETIRHALRESATLVVICSPASARSRWVQEEITAFKRLHGERGVFAFIVSGEPKFAGAADDCFSPALRTEIGPDNELSGRPAEVVAADAREEGDGPKLAFVRLVAGLLGVGFDELRQRELQRRNRRLLVTTLCSVAGMVLTLGLAAFAWHARGEAVLARNDAQRRQDQAEELHAWMLGDVRKEIDKIGRLDALEAVFNASMAYFAKLDERDLTDSALARQAKSLTQLGDVRMKQTRYAEAQRAFEGAYARAQALAERHAQNADVLFERAQAEFWIGEVHRRQGRHSDAANWLVRYRDSSLALAKLEPHALRAQREVIAGYHNLAVLEISRGNLATARRELEAELASVTRLAAAHPKDAELGYRIADVNSWLGRVSEDSGDLPAAAERYAAQVAQLEALMAREPGTAKWRLRLVEGLQFHADVLGSLGNHQAIGESLSRARPIIDALVAQDPKNSLWALTAMSLRVRQAAYHLSTNNADAARPHLEIARETLERLSAAEPSQALFKRWLATACRLEAQRRGSSGETEASAAALKACELGEAIAKAGKMDNRDRGELAQAYIVAGTQAQKAGDDETARQHWSRALESLAPHLAKTADWRLLDPAARAFALLGEREKNGEIIARLEAFGYQPLEPWPQASPSSAQRTQKK